MADGTVVSFNADRHYGFIQGDGSSEHVLVHERDLCAGEQAAWLRKGVRVSYDPVRTDRGLRASNVRTHLETRPRGGQPPGDDEADVLPEGEFREEVHSLLDDALLKFKAGLVDLARRHGWVE